MAKPRRAWGSSGLSPSSPAVHGKAWIVCYYYFLEHHWSENLTQFAGRIPTDLYPEFNFIGRLLGPRGMTLKDMQQESGTKMVIEAWTSFVCLAMASGWLNCAWPFFQQIRGRGSMKLRQGDDLEVRRRKHKMYKTDRFVSDAHVLLPYLPSMCETIFWLVVVVAWQELRKLHPHLDEPLHVLVEYSGRAEFRYEALQLAEAVIMPLRKAHLSPASCKMVQIWSNMVHIFK
jgi:hypothetical protein